MAFTDNSDLYGALHEEGINLVVRHIKRQRPSLFNYGTALIQANPELLCEPIESAPEVTQLITVQPPLPLFGTENFALNYCFQFTGFEIEFHPGNVITLPPQLNPPLQEQRFAFRAEVCGGIGCPSGENRRAVDYLINQTRIATKQARSLAEKSVRNPADMLLQSQTVNTGLLAASSAGSRRAFESAGNFQAISPDRIFIPPVHVFPANKIECFCLELFANGQGAINGPIGNQQISIKLDGLEIVDLAPEGLENSLECYFLLVVNNVILPQVNEAISELLFGVIELGESGSMTISSPGAVPHNPAIEENQLKLFINLEEFSLDIPPIVVDNETEEAPEFTKTIKNRVRTGPSHITAALSEDAFLRIFGTIRDHTTFNFKVEPRIIINTALGKVSAEADIKFHLDDGNISFENNNTIKIDELDIKWDKLQVKLHFDLPKICTPKVCVPFTDICTPQWCVFEDDSDFTITLNIPAIFTSEISINARPKVYYGIGTPNLWLIFLDPIGPVDVDIIDVSDTIGDILDDAIEAVVDALDLPDFVKEGLGLLADVIRNLLDIGDDAGEWIADLIFNTLGVSAGIDDLIANNLANKNPVFKLEDPVEIMPAEGALIPVKIPIEFIGVEVNADEMVISVDIKE